MSTFTSASVHASTPAPGGGVELAAVPAPASAFSLGSPSDSMRSRVASCTRSSAAAVTSCASGRIRRASRSAPAPAASSLSRARSSSRPAGEPLSSGVAAAARASPAASVPVGESSVRRRSPAASPRRRAARDELARTSARRAVPAPCCAAGRVPFPRTADRSTARGAFRCEPRSRRACPPADRSRAPTAPPLIACALTTLAPRHERDARRFLQELGRARSAATQLHDAPRDRDRDGCRAAGVADARERGAHPLRAQESTAVAR